MDDQWLSSSPPDLEISKKQTNIKNKRMNEKNPGKSCEKSRSLPYQEDKHISILCMVGIFY